MADKIVTDNILEKATEGIIQLIADNIFEFESYNDTEIAELFSLTPEEAQHISDLIADTVISQYKLWSSKKVSDELLSAKNECNDYTDTRLANISSISLKYCTTLPSVGESNCIYILKSTDSNPDTLNLYDGTWITIGSFTIKLDDFYKKSEIDTKLDLKADKTEILAQDDVITDTSLATTTNVLSATTTIEELDKKVDKTSIVTSISSTSTDDTVPSAKAVYDNVIKDNNLKTYTRLEQIGLTSGCTVEEIYSALPNDSYFECGTNTTYNNSPLYVINNLPNQYGGLLVIRKASKNVRNTIEYRTTNGNGIMTDLYIAQFKGVDGTGLSWKRVCTTSVVDVSQKTLTYNDTTNYKPESTHVDYGYRVLNGICYLQVYVRVVAPSSSPITICNLPKPVSGVRGVANSWTNNDSSVLAIKYGVYTEDSTFRLWDGSIGQAYIIRDSYPIAES